MQISDMTRFCLDNLSRRKGRTALTVIGVVVGTCFIIMMISFAVAINVSNEEMLASYGDLTKIDVYGSRYGSEESTPLDDAMIENFKAIEHVTVVSPVYQLNDVQIAITSGKKDRFQSYIGGYDITAMTNEALLASGVTLQSGEFLSNETMKKDEIYVMAGQNFGYSFMDSRKTRDNYRDPYPDMNGNIKDPFVDVTKDEIYIKARDPQDYEEYVAGFEYKLNVVGVFNEDWGKGSYTGQGLFTDIDTAKALQKAYYKATDQKYSDETEYNQVYVKVDDMNSVVEVEETIQSFGYSTNSMASIRESMQESTAVLQLILGVIGGVALLVASINIINTMTMAIYERTKEIGVMKVLGCEIGKIRTLFLIEAASLGFIGGAFGVLLSYAFSFGINTFLGGMAGGAKISVVPIWLGLLGFGFAGLIGFLAGIWPAHRATKISALAAIRHD